MKTTKKILLSTFGLLLGLIIAGMVFAKINSFIHPPVEGSGNIITSTQPIASYSSLVVSGNFKLMLKQGESNSMQITGDDNLVELIRVKQQNGELEIILEGRMANNSTLEVELTFQKLEALVLKRASKVTSPDTIVGSSLMVKTSSGASGNLLVENQITEVNSSSGSRVDLSGNTTRVNVNASSGARIKALELKADYAFANASSGAHAEVYGFQNVSIEASSGARVLYGGNPKTRDQRISSGASASKVE